MKMRHLFLGLTFFFAAHSSAQVDTLPPAVTAPPSALTAQLLLAQRPATMTEKQWRSVALNPANATLFPIRLTQAMLDTLDAELLDRRWQYVFTEATNAEQGAPRR